MPESLRNGKKGKAPQRTLPQRMTLFAYWFVVLLFQLIRIFWLKRVRGLENLPAKGPYIIAANHCSQMDSLAVVMLMLPTRVRVLSGEWLCQKFFYRILIEGTGQIKINPESPREGIKNACRELEFGGVLCVFPEGGLSPDGKMKEFSPGLALIARITGAPIIPLRIGGTFEIWPCSKSLPDLFAGRILTMTFGKPFFCEKGEDLVQATEKARRAIAALGDVD